MITFSSQEVKDGEWSDWKDIKGSEACQPVQCGHGYKNQKRSCSRSLGGKYCIENGNEVTEDVDFKTVPCQTDSCPGGLAGLLLR